MKFFLVLAFVGLVYSQLTITAIDPTLVNVPTPAGALLTVTGTDFAGANAVCM